jgi:uncharacterized membrane protein YgcG
MMRLYSAFLIVAVGCAALVLLATRLASSQDKVRLLQATNVAQQQQINNNNQVLTELCRANSTELGIVSALILYVQADPHPQSYRVRSTLAILAGQGVKLGQQTACEDVSHP